jgi:nucleoside phosphorylase
VIVDSKWARRNLGTDQGIDAAAEAMRSTLKDDQTLRRELIDFDSESSDLQAFGARVQRATTGLSKFVDIKWPSGLAPTPGAAAPPGESLPEADVLMVTWTVDEGHALARVLTPGFDSRDDWKAYTKNLDEIAKHMVPRCPARQAGRLGTYWTTTIGDTRVTLFKSDSHMSQDGPELPNAIVWKQIIEDCKPKWVITTGTGGGIGPDTEVGDVIVSRFVSFDCKREFKRLNDEAYDCPENAPDRRFTSCADLFKFNAGFLPADNGRPPQIVVARAADGGILTTDFFGFDNTADTYGLQGKGSLSEMGDAVLGMVCKDLGAAAPDYVIVRNVSDPEIDSTGKTLAEQKKLAADIYKAYGRWSSVCSAIVCWAIAAAV